ncbi:hypothetical protein [Streptomyces sp. 8L]|uniref:hypothetical protein n=1 Tax=Streptomyces sp. 8L TaxID=2877242 RepID=UPI001CD2A397|nr:hypothetical protein [Streptomyces sp. 8L]MCA1224038.1 hypothetical protein [Streptomyces sp. 8L]
MSEYDVACHLKQRYRDRRSAKHRANQIRTTGGDALKPYQCKFCLQWHLGHRPGEATYLRRSINGPIPIKELPR